MQLILSKTRFADEFSKPLGLFVNKISGLKENTGKHGTAS